MAHHDKDEEVVGVTEFKARCLGLIDAVTSGKLSRVVLTKRGKRIAIVTAMPEASNEL